MNLDDIYNFYNQLIDDNLSFLYQGTFSNEFSEKIMKISELNIDKHEISFPFKKKIAFLIAESFQNIVKHGQKFKSEDAFGKGGIYIIRFIEDTYIITTANLIEKNKVEKLQTKLDEINQLGKTELKEKYLEILRNSEFSEKGDAGLGLIEMARKTNNKLIYEFETKDDDNFACFYLQLKIRLSKEENGEKVAIPLDNYKKIHGLMRKNNIYLAYRGDFSQSVVIDILRIIERNLEFFNFEQKAIKQAIYHILAEMLQNISRHASLNNERKEGIFLIGKHADTYYISTGNFMKNKNADHLVDTIESINKTDKEELNRQYLEMLKTGDMDKKGEAGLGLIDIARECKDTIDYKITKVDDTSSFLTLNVNY